MSPHQNRMIVRGLLKGVTLGKRRAYGQVSMRAGEVAAKVELFLPYGMSANPLPGGDVIVLTIGGTRDHLVAFLDDSSLRIPALAAGEFGWRDQNGQQIVFRTDHVEITTTKPLKIAASEVDITGNVNVTGTVTASVDVVGGGKSLKTHVHSGVTTGAGNTGQPV